MKPRKLGLLLLILGLVFLVGCQVTDLHQTQTSAEVKPNQAVREVAAAPASQSEQTIISEESIRQTCNSTDFQQQCISHFALSARNPDFCNLIKNVPYTVQYHIDSCKLGVELYRNHSSIAPLQLTVSSTKYALSQVDEYNYGGYCLIFYYNTDSKPYLSFYISNCGHKKTVPKACEFGRGYVGTQEIICDYDKTDLSTISNNHIRIYSSHDVEILRQYLLSQGNNPSAIDQLLNSIPQDIIDTCHYSHGSCSSTPFSTTVGPPPTD